jgi:hypothetical protein
MADQLKWAFQRNPDGTFKAGLDNLTAAEAEKLLLLFLEIEKERDRCH